MSKSKPRYTHNPKTLEILLERRGKRSLVVMVASDQEAALRAVARLNRAEARAPGPNAAPTADQIEIYNAAMLRENVLAGASYQTGPRRGQQRARTRNAAAVAS